MGLRNAKAESTSLLVRFVSQLRDYRNSLQAAFGETLQALPRTGRDGDWMPTVQRVLLQRNSGNIFKDLKSMDFDGWTFRECLVGSPSYIIMCIIYERSLAIRSSL